MSGRDDDLRKRYKMAPLQNLCLPVPTRVGGVAVTRDELKRGDKVPPSTWHLDGVHIPATGTKARYRILYHPCISGTSHIPSAASESTPKAPFLILLSHTSHNFFHLERGLSIAKSIAGKKKKRQWPAIWQSAGKYPLWEPCGGACSVFSSHGSGPLSLSLLGSSH